MAAGRASGKLSASFGTGNNVVQVLFNHQLPILLPVYVRKRRQEHNHDWKYVETQPGV